MSSPEAETQKRAKKVIVDDDEEEDFPENDINPQPTEEAQPEGQEQQDDDDDDDMKDLFGDDDDDDEEPASKLADDTGIVADSDEDDFIREDDSQFRVEENIKQRELRIENLDIIRHPPKFSRDETSNKDLLVYTARIPKYLKVDPSRFDGRSYLQNLKNSIKTLNQEQLELNRLVDQNTIRWRFTKESQGSSLKAESNSQIIEWEDGSLSLKVGEELFDILQNDLVDTELVTSQDSLKKIDTPVVYLADGLIQKNLKFIPTSTNSSIHRKLASLIQSRQQNAKPEAQSVFVDIDPAAEARLLEKQMGEKMRERRRLELKAEKEKSSNTTNPRSSQSITSRYSQQSYRRDEYEDEDDDGFLVDEDEEEEVFDDVDEDDDVDDLATERLRRIKEDGASKYRRTEIRDDEDDERENTEEGSRKKRRVIEDDEDDE